MMLLPPPNPAHLRVLQPGEKGSNSYFGARKPYVRKNIQMRSMEAKIRDAMIHRGIALFKPQFIKTDLSLRTFGTLVCMRCVGVDAARKAWWAVVCLCGNVDIVRASALTNGQRTELACCKRKHRNGRRKVS